MKKATATSELKMNGRTARRKISIAVRLGIKIILNAIIIVRKMAPADIKGQAQP
jgi:hypothetical protein